MHKVVQFQIGRMGGRARGWAWLGLVVSLGLSVPGAAYANGEKTPSNEPAAAILTGSPSIDATAPAVPRAGRPAEDSGGEHPETVKSEKGASKEKAVKAASPKKKKQAKKKRRVRKRRRGKKRSAKRSRARGREKKKKGCQTYTPARYKRMRRRWLKQPKIAKPGYREGFRDMAFFAINLGERVRINPYLPNGELDPEALEALEPLFRDKHDHSAHPVHPRLLKLLYKILDHFKARQITIISGYRSKPGHARESNHAMGRAIDFVIPGVPVAVLARYVRRLGKVGVGHYPNSGFVHLDVRERGSYFWVDRSGPGQPQCPKRVLTKAGRKIDARYRAKHDRPRRRKDRRGRPLGAVKKMGAAAP